MQGGALDARILVCIWPLWPPMGAQTEPQEHGRPGSGSWWHITDPDPDLWSLSWGSSELALAQGRHGNMYACLMCFLAGVSKNFNAFFAWTLRLFMQASLPLPFLQTIDLTLSVLGERNKDTAAAFAHLTLLFSSTAFATGKGGRPPSEMEKESQNSGTQVSTFMTFEDACLSFVVIFCCAARKLMEAQKGCSGANAKLWWAKCLPFATSHTQKQYSEIWSCDSAVWNHCLVLFHQRHVFLVCYFTNNHQHSKLLLFQEFKAFGDVDKGDLRTLFMFARKPCQISGQIKDHGGIWPIRENLDVRGVGVDPPVLTFPNSYILQRDEQFGGSFQVLFSGVTCEGYGWY